MRTLPILILTGVCGFAAGTVVKLAPSADSALEVRGNQKKALLRFDLAALPAGSTVISARLVFRLDGVRSESPVLPKRFSFSAGETRIRRVVCSSP